MEHLSPKRTAALKWTLPFVMLLFAISLRAQTVVNKYSEVENLADLSTCSPKVILPANNSGSINTASNSGVYSPSDRIIIIQMKGVNINTSLTTDNFGDVTNYNNAGNWEFATVALVSATDPSYPGKVVLTLGQRLAKGYTPSGRVQVIRIPSAGVASQSYGSLTCQAWDGRTGGVLALEASTSISLSGNIDVSEKGFRGGRKNKYEPAVTCSGGYVGYGLKYDVCATGPFTFSFDRYFDFNFSLSGQWEGGEKGEGIVDLDPYLGTTQMDGGMGKAANGGGGGNHHNTGGGGGSNFGAGGRGSQALNHDNGGRGGLALPYVLSSGYLNQLFLGGGGGGGQQGDIGYSTADATDGKPGGGIVIISTITLTNTHPSLAGNILSKGGTPPLPSGGSDDDGAGGGGAGGTIVLLVDNYTGTTISGTTFSLSANGGNGGSLINNCGPGTGGGGGGGVIALKTATTPANVATSVSGGPKGIYTTTTCPLANNTDGATGNVINGVSLEANLSCCYGFPADIYIPFTSTTINASSADNDRFWQGKYTVNSPITVDGVVLDLTNVDVIFGSPTAGFTFINGATLRANNSVFRACDPLRSWAGFSFTDNSRGYVHECTFKNAQVALDQSTFTTALRVTNNLFSNCLTSIAINTSSNASPESISGNTFQVDNMPIVWPSYSSGYNDHFGIKITATDVKDLITQNNFVYNGKKLLDASGNNIRFFGIWAITSSGVISDNKFTNMYRGIDLQDVIGFFSVENNEFTITQDINNNLTDHYQVRIGNAAPIIAQALVFNNSFSNKLGNSNALEQAAIYSEFSNGVTISNNTIKGFTTGIYLFNVNGGSIVSLNNIEAGTVYGIYAEDCNNVDINGNVIKLSALTTQGALAQHGIHYRHIMPWGGPPASKIRNNCVYDTRVAIYLATAGNPVNGPSMATNNIIPEIRNNFLYNYFSQGIYNDYFRNNAGCGIGCGCTPDLSASNTFASNYKGKAGFAITDVVSNNGFLNGGGGAAPVLQVFGNYFVGAAATTGCANNTCGLVYYASTTCGQMVKKLAGPLTNEEIFSSNILQRYPLAAVADGYTLSADLNTTLKEIPQPERLSYVLGMMNVLAANTSYTELDALMAKMSTTGLLDADQKAWLVYYGAYMKEEYEAARTALAAISPANVDARELQYLEGMKLDIKTKALNLAALPAEVLQALETIDTRRGAHAATARDMIHAAVGGHDYIFRKPAPFEAKAPEGSEMNSSLGTTCLSVYPNPVRDAFTIQYNVEDIIGARLSLVDVTGRTMLDLPINYNNSVMKVNVDGMARGVYILSIIRSNEVIATTRIVVE